MIAVWLALNLGLGLTGDLLTPGLGGIAWEAHVGGFVAGLLLLGAFDPVRRGEAGRPGRQEID